MMTNCHICKKNINKCTCHIEFETCRNALQKISNLNHKSYFASAEGSLGWFDASDYAYDTLNKLGLNNEPLDDYDIQEELL